MFAVQTISKVSPQLRSATKAMSTIAGPPKVRMSFAEKIAHGVAIGAGIMAFPSWVLVHIKDYRGHEEAA